MTDGIPIRYHPPAHEKHLETDGGLLPNCIESSALWEFLVCAMQALEKIPTQKTLVGTLDTDVNLREVANGIAKMYGLSTLDNVFHPVMIQLAKREAIRCRLPWDSRLDAWFQSGGRAYNLLTRNPDTIQ